MAAAKKPKRTQKTGGAYVTDEWLTAVRRAMAARSMSQQALARRVGASQPSISALLRGQAARTELAGAISALLEIPRPEVATGDALLDRAIIAVRRLVELNPQLLEQELKRFDAMATALEFDAKERKADGE